jgi:hypothetical protein
MDNEDNLFVIRATMKAISAGNEVDIDTMRAAFLSALSEYERVADALNVVRGILYGEE